MCGCGPEPGSAAAAARAAAELASLGKLGQNVSAACAAGPLSCAAVRAGLLEHALVRDGTSELAVAALEALLEEAGAAPRAFAAHYRPRLTWLQGFLGHADAAGAAAALVIIRLRGLSFGGFADALPAQLRQPVCGSCLRHAKVMSDRGRELTQEAE
jgi:hypothetical protein